MIATCPACGKRYRVPDDAVPAAGRHVRCAACGHGWVVVADGTAAPASAPSPPAPRLDPAPSPPAAAPPGGAPAVAAGRSMAPAGNAPRPASPSPAAERPSPPSDALPPEPAVDAGPRPSLHRASEPLPPARTAARADPAPLPEPRPALDVADESGSPPRRGRGWWLVALLLVVLAALGGAAVVEFAPADTFSPPRLGLPAPDAVARDLPGLPAIDVPPLDLRRVPLVGDALDRLVNPPAAAPSPLRVVAHGQRSILANGTRVMTVTGTVTNPTDADVALERIDAALLDPAGHPLFRWRIDGPGVIVARASAPVESVAANYPAAATVLQLTPR